jgi:hypothetical protein
MPGVDGDSSPTRPLWEPDDENAREETIAEMSRHTSDILSTLLINVGALRVHVYNELLFLDNVSPYSRHPVYITDQCWRAEAARV